MTPRLIVFDLGGVLVRICRSWSEACAAAGLPVHADSTLISASGRRHALAERHGRGGIASGEFFQLVAASMDNLYTPEQVRRIHDAWLLGPYPGAADLLLDLRRAGLATGILSNTNHAHWIRLTPAHRGGTGEFFGAADVDHPHASHVLGLLKPDPAIYRAFEEHAGAAPADILFFDDLHENVDAARDRGWHAEVIDHAGDPIAQIRAHLAARGLRQALSPPAGPPPSPPCARSTPPPAASSRP